MSLLNYREYMTGQRDNNTLDTSVDATALITFKMIHAVKNCSATPIVELCTALSQPNLCYLTVYLVCAENSRHIVSVKLQKFDSYDADTRKQIVKSEHELAEAVRHKNNIRFLCAQM